MIGVELIGFAVVYGLSRGSAPLVIANGLILIQVVAMSAVKLHSRRDRV